MNTLIETRDILMVKDKKIPMMMISTASEKGLFKVHKDFQFKALVPAICSPISRSGYDRGK